MPEKPRIMARLNNILLFFALLPSGLGDRINFTSCQNAEWSCVNSLPNDITFTCSVERIHEVVIHLKDYYTDHITSVTVQNCRDVKVVLDCPILQRVSHLQQFKILNCDRLEFISLSKSSLLQTPPEVTIENVNYIVSFPNKLFKSPTTSTEQKCLGSTSLKKIRVANSKINKVVSGAMSNVTGIKNIEFSNVTIVDLETNGIEALMGNDNTLFSMINSNIENINYFGIKVHSATATITDNTFGDILSTRINITSDHLQLNGNKFEAIHRNGLVLKSINTEIKNNYINLLKNGALSSVKCMRKKSNMKHFYFSSNQIKIVEPNSLIFDHASCKSAGAIVAYDNNKIDCKCINIAFLNSVTTNAELNSIILDAGNNNTCLSAPCVLPVDIVKMLLESDMCNLNLDPQVMCLLYSDKHSNNEVTTDEEVTEPPPTFYLMRQANLPNGDVSAAMTAVDKDDLLKDMNMTNRTPLKVVFDSSRDFVETLRSTSSTRKRPTEEKVAPREEYLNRCVGPQCRNNVAYNKQKALDFYKYVYAQLRVPRQGDNTKKKT